MNHGVSVDTGCSGYERDNFCFFLERKRISSERSLRRNYFVAALATSIFIPYAAPKSSTEMFCQEILKWGKQVYTIDDERNKNLVAEGLKPVSTEIFK